MVVLDSAPTLDAVLLLESDCIAAIASVSDETQGLFLLHQTLGLVASAGFGSSNFGVVLADPLTSVALDRD